jgi:uncharacterized repeat protein (TIGR03803 family)
MDSRPHRPKNRAWRPFAVAWMTVTAVLLYPGSTTAQVPTATETILYSFANGADGTSPSDLVPYSDGNLYGVTSNTMFKITPNGTLTTQYTFCTSSPLCPNGKPLPAGLTLGPDKQSFYGLSESSSGPAGPAFFRITPAGVYTPVLTLPGSDGNPAAATPNAGAKLVLGSDGNFYGTNPGPNGTSGSIFRITPAGVFTTIHTFSPTTSGVNSDGAMPYGRLVQASTDHNFYGTTNAGGLYAGGTVFKFTLAGAFTSLYSFGTVGGVGASNADGRNPFAGLTEGSDGNLYGGTPNGGGASDIGTLFRITTGGTLTTLHQFKLPGNLTLTLTPKPATISLGQFTTLTWSLAGTISNEGGGLKQSLLQGLDGNFYGFGGEVQSGVNSVFQLTPAGAFTTILPPPSGETEPDSLFQSSDGKFYGTNYYGGGAGNNGSVFELTLGSSPPATPCTAGISPGTGGGTFTGAQAINGTLAVTPTVVGTYYYSLTCTFPGNLFSPTVGPIYAQVNVSGPALPSYTAGQLNIPTISIGRARFDNMVVTLGSIVSGPAGAGPNTTEVTYDTGTNQMSIPAVTVGTTTYYNLVITVGSLVSIGSMTGGDTYDGTHLSIPSVQILGGSAYHDVVVTVARIVSAGGGMPTSVRDVYNPATQQLTIAAIQPGSTVYTNAIVTVGTVVSVGGAGP